MDRNTDPAADRRRPTRLEILKQLLLLMVAPGAGIRRWLLLGAAGGVIFGIGIEYLIRYYTTLRPPQILPWNLEGVVLIALAFIMTGIASWRLTERIGKGTASRLPDETLRESLMRLRRHDAGHAS